MQVNLNLVNLEPTEWSRQDWQDAYAGYCEANLYGPKTKREYYDWVLERCKKMNPEPLSDELKRKWTIGKRNARLWAKKHGCDMNGRLLLDVKRAAEDASAIEIADRAESIAIDTQNLLDELIERARRRRANK